MSKPMKAPRKPLAPGDMVRVYFTNGQLEPYSVCGEIKEIRPNGLLELHQSPQTYSKYKPEHGGYDMTLVHPKQCRRLRKKPRPASRKRMVRFYFPHDNTIYDIKQQHTDKQVRLEEVREGEKILAVYDLEKAWRSSEFATLASTNGKGLFDKFVAALGFGGEK